MMTSWIKAVRGGMEKMGETFQLYLESEWAGLAFCAVDLNAGNILSQEKTSHFFFLDYQVSKWPLGYSSKN